jgi:hypothetical protein
MKCPDEECGCGGIVESCWACGGEGEFDAYEEDPLWYEPGETKVCSTCLGRGEFRVCLLVEAA